VIGKQPIQVRKWLHFWEFWKWERTSMCNRRTYICISVR
jgi:hypothetical protein